MVGKSLLMIVIFLKIFLLCGLSQDVYFSADKIKINKLPEENHKYYISEIKIEGNKTTKVSIILRELVFEQSDSIYIDRIKSSIQRSRENLLNTSLFNFVTIKYSQQSDNDIIIIISVEEKWYIWPFPIFEHADRNLSAWLNKKDLSMINYGLYVLRENFRGRREILKLKTRLGYKEQYSLLYIKPFIDRNNKHGFAIEIAYNRQKQLIFKTEKNRPAYLSGNDDYQLNYFYSNIYYTYRPGLYSSHIFSAGHNNANAREIMQLINPWFFLEGENRMIYNTLSYTFIRDLRDSRVYPLKGSYINLGMQKLGLGINKTAPDLLQLTMTYGKYFSSGKKLHSAHDFSAKKTFGEYEPYF